MSIRFLKFFRNDETPNYYSKDGPWNLSLQEKQERGIHRFLNDDPILGKDDSVYRDGYTNNFNKIVALYEAGNLPEYIKVEKDEVKYVGCVIEKHIEYGVRVMSDVFEDIHTIVVFKPEFASILKRDENGKLIYNDEVHTALKSYWNGESNKWVNKNPFYHEGFSDVQSWEVDASEEVKQLYKDYIAAEKEYFAEKQKQLEDSRRQQEIIRERKSCVPGKVIKVVKGRKVPVGVIGLAFWQGYDNYQNHNLGIATDTEKSSKTGKNGKVYHNAWKNVQFVSSKNCIVLGAETEYGVDVARVAFLHNLNPEKILKAIEHCSFDAAGFLRNVMEDWRINREDKDKIILDTINKVVEDLGTMMEDM